MLVMIQGLVRYRERIEAIVTGRGGEGAVRCMVYGIWMQDMAKI